MVRARWLGVLLGLVFCWWIAPFFVSHTVPVSRYYDLRSVFVSDATYGEVPTMIVDRSINREFRGWYEVEIRKSNGSSFEACGPTIKSAERTYRVGAVLPDPLTLNWWLDVPPNLAPCPMFPGQYRLVTTIYARHWTGAVLSVERSSPLFTIHEARK